MSLSFCAIYCTLSSRKLDAMICHERFTQYKTAATEAEREQARQRYLESIGMPADFRW